VANNVGFALISGASIRYRFYTRWGLGAEELSRIIFSYSITFWLGLLALGGLSLALTPQLRIGTLPGPIVELVGWMLLRAERRLCRLRRHQEGADPVVAIRAAAAAAGDCDGAVGRVVRGLGAGGVGALRAVTRSRSAVLSR
jgi:hypothetical protein